MGKENWDNLFSKPKKEIKFKEIDDVVDASYVKDLRNKFNFSQRFFAKVLGISEKTIEKWEQGKNPVKGTASRLLFLLNKYDFLLDDLYTETKIAKNKESEYMVQEVNEKISKKRITYKKENSQFCISSLEKDYVNNKIESNYC